LPYQISWKKHGAVKKFCGYVTLKEFLSCNESVWGDSRFDTVRYQVLDLLEVTMAETSDTAKTIRLVERIAATDNAAAKSNPDVKIAIVVRGETLATLANLYSAELSDSSWVCEVFETVEAAGKWVGESPLV